MICKPCGNASAEDEQGAQYMHSRCEGCDCQHEWYESPEDYLTPEGIATWYQVGAQWL